MINCHSSITHSSLCVHAFVALITVHLYMPAYVVTDHKYNEKKTTTKKKQLTEKEKQTCTRCTRYGGSHCRRHSSVTYHRRPSGFSGTTTISSRRDAMPNTLMRQEKCNSPTVICSVIECICGLHPLKQRCHFIAMCVSKPLCAVINSLFQKMGKCHGHVRHVWFGYQFRPHISYMSSVDRCITKCIRRH